MKAYLVSSHNNTPISLRIDTNNIFGRGFTYGISDRRISRKHGEIIVSSASKSVTIRPLSIVPSEVIRAEDLRAHSLEKDVLFELKHGDKIRLLNGLYEFTLHIEDDETKEMEDFSEDATQLDLDALEELQRRNMHTNMSTKRYRGDEENGSVKRFKGDGEFRAPLTSTGSALLINPSELEIVKTVGVGSCGEVFEAMWRGTKVAVKKIFRTLLHGNSMREFQMESDMLRRLRHPSIVLWMGTCLQGRDMCIVTEFIERGSLREVLSSQSIVLDWPTILNMAIDAARGMNYLHTFAPPIIHRDLKSHNLLVDKNFRVKVTDFGLAKFQVDDKATTFCGTLPWTAPEVFKGVGYSEKCDVYSFGIVLWELFTRKEPYSGMNKPDIIVGVSQQALRPVIPDDCPAPYAQLMSDCWHEDPTKRPSFTEVLHRLEQLQQLNEAKNNRDNSSMAVMPTPMNLTQQFRTFKDSNAVNQNWEIEPSELEFLEEVSEGTTATVYKGRFRAQQVAIKVLKESLDGKHKEDFKKELEVMSPSVVFFYGACIKPQLSIVTELLPNGSLYDIMNRTDIKYDWELVIKLCTEAATAVNTLHCWKPPVVHRDLKPQNLLVDHNWAVKVADLGLARFHTQENSASLAKLRGTYLYAAPETYNGAQYTTKSDVYSFGIIMWELVIRCITGSYKKPYSEHKNLKFDFQIIIQTAKNGLRPVIHSSCPPPFADLMRKCWDQSPELRPTFQEILLQLHSIHDLFEREQAAKN